MTESEWLSRSEAKIFGIEKKLLIQWRHKLLHCIEGGSCLACTARERREFYSAREERERERERERKKEGEKEREKRERKPFKPLRSKISLKGLLKCLRGCSSL